MILKELDLTTLAREVNQFVLLQLRAGCGAGAREGCGPVPLQLGGLARSGYTVSRLGNGVLGTPHSSVRQSAPDQR